MRTFYANNSISHIWFTDKFHGISANLHCLSWQNSPMSIGERSCWKTHHLVSTVDGSKQSFAWSTANFLDPTAYLKYLHSSILVPNCKFHAKCSEKTCSCRRKMAKSGWFITWNIMTHSIRFICHSFEERDVFLSERRRPSILKYR